MLELKMDTRPPKPKTFLKIASVLAEQSTCHRRSVGAILTNKLDQIIGSGYNGVAKGLPHCISDNCAGAVMPTGEGLGVCEAIHAEQNALMQCSDIKAIHSVYCTTSPCMHCIKMLMNTSAKHIYFIDCYTDYEKTMALWCSSDIDRDWTQYSRGILK